MPTTDRDLLALEPNLFRDMGWLGQRLVSGTGSIAGTTLTLADADVGLDDAAVGAGHVVQVDQTPYEVLARLSATELTVSRLRADPGGDPLPPTPASGKPVAIYTFAPQLALARAQALRMLGIDPDGESGGPTEGDILDPGALRAVIALAALHLVFSAAAAASAPDAQSAKAAMYRDRFAAAMRRITVELDTDGDGEPDALRRASAAYLHRA
jgi:hypothetical protein